MLKIRVIPCLLLRNQGLVKTVKFKDPVYVGDPVNAVKIFNEKKVDELIFLDIQASKDNKRPDFKMIEDIASECFMPFCYGGGIRSIEDIKTIFSLGGEKVSINSYALESPIFIKEASEFFGSQSIVVAIDVKKNLFGRYRIYHSGKSMTTDMDPGGFAIEAAKLGAGEIFLNSVDQDGMMNGYDLDLIKKVSDSVDIPVIACGGAGKLDDFSDAVRNGHASAVAAGSMFVFYGRHKAVLINYPEEKDIEAIFKGL